MVLTVVLKKHQVLQKETISCWVPRVLGRLQAWQGRRVFIHHSSGPLRGEAGGAPRYPAQGELDTGPPSEDPVHQVEQRQAASVWTGGW